MLTDNYNNNNNKVKNNNSNNNKINNNKTNNNTTYTKNNDNNRLELFIIVTILMNTFEQFGIDYKQFTICTVYNSLNVAINKNI